MKRRIKRVAVVYGIVAAMLLAYYVFVRLTGVGIPCIVRRVTGFSCPGCGNSRALIALLHLDFLGAVKYNLLIFPELLFVGYVLITVTARYIKTGVYSMTFQHEGVLWLFLVLLVVWTVVRNIYGI